MTPPEKRSGQVLLRHHDSVATLVLSHPGAMNALTWDMYDQLVLYLEQLAQDDRIRVLVVRGDGDRAFAAGTDITQFRGFTPDDGVAYERRIDTVLTALLRFPKPTVAAIQGYAVGGGMALASACDLRYANPGAQLGIPVARTLGNCLALHNYRRLQDLLGPMRLKELIFTGRLMDAAEALSVGFLTAVFPTDQFEEDLFRVVATIAANAPLTIWATKIALIRLQERAAEMAQDVAFDDVVRRVYGSEDFHEAVRARMRHTTFADWQGR